MNPINQRLLNLEKQNRKLKRKLKRQKSRPQRQARKFIRNHSLAIVLITCALVVLNAVGGRLIGKVVHLPVDPGVVIVAIVVAALGTGMFIILHAFGEK